MGALLWHWLKSSIALMTKIDFVPEAAADYLALDHSIRLDVRKAIAKLERDPRAYGEPLGNKAGIDLYGYFSIRAGDRIRVIYSVDSQNHVIIRVIGKRERFLVHKTAEGRIHSIAEATAEELRHLRDVLAAAGESL